VASPAEQAIEHTQLVGSDTIDIMPKKSFRKKFRKIAGIIGGVFFVLAIAISSMLMFWGGNTISGQNISINASGPLAVGGGEEYEFQVAVANQNTVPIQSATLVIEYPKGTREASESEKEISIVRQSLETIDTGELVNIPLKARIFGEENEDKEIKVWIEYRVAGSNATFEKYAEPIKIKVTTSPIVVTFDTVKAISSGQEVEIDLIVQSNSPTPLTDTLVKVTYPEGFDFTESDPDTVSGEDTWKIGNLEPNEKEVITIKGLLTGYENDVRRFSASAGVAKDGAPNTLGAQLANASTEITIEQPFLDVEVVINGSPSETVVVTSTSDSQVEIAYRNSLDTAIYDGSVEVKLGGNALSDYEVRTDGFYDSGNKTIKWDGSNTDALKEVAPGNVVRLGFALRPSDSIRRTPEVTMQVDVTGSRLYENRASQTLQGSISRTMKVEGVPKLTSRTNYGEGPFTNTGPTPPVVEKVTQYTYLLTAKAGVNDLTGAEVTAVLPQGVTWLDLVTSGAEVTYNATTRTLRWNIGNLDANEEVTAGVQISFKPSTSQVGLRPTILETQRFKATDRFTGTTVRTSAPALDTNYSNDQDDQAGVGRVQAN
jgi:hypothetical protein